MKTLTDQFRRWIDSIEREYNTTSGRAAMMKDRKRARRGNAFKHYPLPLWKKCVTFLMLFLTLELIVPPQLIAQEIAEAQQRAAIEQSRRDARTKAPAHLHVAQQTEATVQLLLRTCRQIEHNVIAGKSIAREIKDIEAFQKNFEEIKTRSLKQMELLLLIIEVLFLRKRL